MFHDAIKTNKTTHKTTAGMTTALAQSAVVDFM